jgi:excisionase family DNA binding protein
MTRKPAVESSDGNPTPSARGPLAPLDVHQRYEIDEAARYLRISRSRLYQKIAASEIRLLKDGRRSFVPGSEIAAAST